MNNNNLHNLIAETIVTIVVGIAGKYIEESCDCEKVKRPNKNRKKKQKQEVIDVSIIE